MEGQRTTLTSRVDRGGYRQSVTAAVTGLVTWLCRPRPTQDSFELRYAASYADPIGQPRRARKLRSCVHSDLYSSACAASLDGTTRRDIG